MAVAEKTTVERVVTEDGFTLKLTVEEAETLVAVLSRVGGSPYTSPRKHAGAVLDALREAGTRAYWEDDHPPDQATGSIQFDDYPVED
ncbi:hypothetical protein ABZ352_35545 [Streptomyces griseofuscus]|uniref:hypothetical protein n=1 Tax=Streptomyces griseofuscus TaxID=146922 RepID=UPI0033D3F698